MTTPPKISLALPVHNGADYLSESLDCLLAQTCGEFELIVSDNASSDETEEIVRDYMARDSRIVYYRQAENIGAYLNFNTCFELARGEYFKWHAHDDLCHPEFLARCLELLESDRSLAWCHTWSSHIGPDGQLLADPRWIDVSYLTPGMGDGPYTRASERPHQRFSAVLLGQGGCLDEFGLIRSDVLRQTAMHRPYFGYEKVLTSELALRGRYAEVPETLFFVRVHHEGAGVQGAEGQMRIANPQARGPQFTRLNLLFGYLRTVRRVPLPGDERRRCYRAIGRYLLQVSKWKSVVRKALRGQGVGGNHAERLNNQTTAVDDRPLCTISSSRDDDSHH